LIQGEGNASYIDSDDQKVNSEGGISTLLIETTEGQE
jgi:hypothetical protein